MSDHPSDYDELAYAYSGVLVERDRYREVLAFIAWEEWTEDDPLEVRDKARAALSR